VAQRLLYLVRHAEVILRGDVHPSDWALSPQGEADARDLARSPAWRSVTLVASSPEKKTRQTAEPIAAAARVDLRIEDDLREVERGMSGLVSAEEYPALVAAHFASSGDNVGGWERGADARTRAVACIESLLAEPDEQLCIVSHGMVLSHYLAHVRGLETPVVEEWRAIPLPAVAVVDPEARELVKPFMSLMEFLGRR
jgi:broad specificity phosphatase PhoE